MLNIALNVMLIPGCGPIPAFGTRGAAIGTSAASALVSGVGIWLLLSGRLVVSFPRTMSWRPDWSIVRSLFRFGLPAGVQGVAMNLAGVMLLRFIGSLEHSAEAQAAYAVGYAELFSLITWTSVGLMGAAGGRRRAEPRRRPSGPDDARRVDCVADRPRRRGCVSAMFLLIPEQLLAIFGLKDPIVVNIGKQLLRYLSVSGFFITVALTYTGGLQGTGDTRSPLYITLVSQVVVPIGLVRDASGDWAGSKRPACGPPFSSATHALRPDGDAVPAGEMAHHRRGVVFAGTCSLRRSGLQADRRAGPRSHTSGSCI